MRPIIDHFLNRAFIFNRDVKALRLSVDSIEFLTGFADRRCIDNRHQLLDIIFEEVIKESCVPVADQRKDFVFLKRFFCLVNSLQSPLGLMLQRRHSRRKQSAQFPFYSGILTKGCSLIDERIIQSFRSHTDIFHFLFFRKTESSTERSELPITAASDSCRKRGTSPPSNQSTAYQVKPRYDNFSGIAGG